MAGGRGEAEIRTSDPIIDIGEVLSLEPEEASHIFRKDRQEHRSKTPHY